MGREFVEFVQSQWLDWHPAGLPGERVALDAKLLSADDTDGSRSLLLRFPAGWRADLEPLAVDEECFLLQGTLTRGGLAYQPHDYAYFPAGYASSIAAGPTGAIALAFFSARPALSAGLDFDRARLIERLRPSDLPWDRTNMDPNIAHLNAFRKNLRLDPGGACRSYLLAGLPQGYPASGTEPLERHPHVEEMFMVAGDMPCSRGVMRAGAYFWRPPLIWHGADCTRNGFLCFMRTPGANRTVSEWGAPHPVLWDPPHDPVLPAALAGRGPVPLPDPVAY